MTKQKVKEIIEYWQKTAAHDYKTMIVLFREKRYADTLFYGHIILEKILKAHVVYKTGKQAEYTHNLIKLMKDAGIKLDAKDQDLLDIVNDFNVRARYPDEKMRFYKKCTKKYTEHYIEQIKKLYKALCQILKKSN